MASVSIILNTKKYKDGTQPVTIRVIVGSIVRRKVLFSVKKADWDGKAKRVKWTSPLAADYNALIAEKENYYKSKVLQLQLRKVPFTADDVLKEDSSKDIIRLIKIKADKASPSLAATFIRVIDLLQKFAETQKLNGLTVETFDVKTAQAFIDFLFAQKFKSSTVKLYCSKLKTVLLENESNVFKHVKIQGVKSSRTAATISWEEFKNIERAVLKARNLDLARDVFLLQVYTRGSRVGEVYEMQKPVNGYIETISSKTKKLRKIKVTHEIQSLIDKYQGQSKHFIIPALPDNFNSLSPVKKLENRKRLTAKINGNLKKLCLVLNIDSSITTHSARHTFAYRAVTKGLNLNEIQHLLNHSNPAMTANYLKKLVGEDELNDITGKLFED